MKPVVAGLLIIVILTAGWLYFYKRQVADLNNQGVAYIQSQNYKKAIEVLEKARSKLPENPVVLKNLGQAYDKAGQLQKAFYYYNLALTYSPEPMPEIFQRMMEIKPQTDTTPTPQSN